jgi:hypothetical protein
MQFFSPDQFTPTKWSSAEEKAKFGNDLLTFILSDCPEGKFTAKLYERLSNCFGHIAHYDKAGFFDTWFSSAATRSDFLNHLCEDPCFGSPECTFSDVERAVQRKVEELNLRQGFASKASDETRQHDLTLLAALQAKYGTGERVQVGLEALMPPPPSPPQFIQQVQF